MHVLLGDQSPFNGGLLRAKAIAEAKLPGVKAITYHFHDTDTPWLQRGKGLRILRGSWPEYWATAARHPYTLDAPGLKARALWEGIQHSLKKPQDGQGWDKDKKIPAGLMYLVGPYSDVTLCSKDHWQMRELNEHMRALFDSEVQWARTLATYLGITANEPRKIPRCVEDIEPAAEERLTKMGVSVHTTTEHWRERRLELRNKVPPALYWVIDHEGKRKKWDGNPISENSFLAPGGKILMLEYALEGYSLAFSGMPYLDEVRKLRDQYIPGVEVRYLKVDFNWCPAENIAERLCEEFTNRKRHRASLPTAKGKKIPDYVQEDLQTISSYWAGRPTTLSYEILGGDLNPTITIETL